MVKSGGTSAQILAADGSVITAGTNITISGGTISASGGGGTTIYSGDGTLSGNRTVTLGGNSLTIKEVSASTFSQINIQNDGTNYASLASIGSANSLVAWRDKAVLGSSNDILIATNSNVSSGGSGVVRYYIGGFNTTEQLTIGNNYSTFSSPNNNYTLSVNTVNTTTASIITLTSSGSVNNGFILSAAPSFSYGTYIAKETTLAGYGVVSLRTSDTGYIRFLTGNSDPNFSTEKARLTSAGRLLLGTTSESTFLLDVNGTARVSGALTAGTNSSIAGISFPGSNIIDFPSSEINLRYGGNSIIKAVPTEILFGSGIFLRAVSTSGNIAISGGGGGPFASGSGRIMLGMLAAYNTNSTDSYFISIGHESLFSTTSQADNIAIGGRFAGSGASRGNTGNHTTSFFFGTATGATTNSVSLTNTYIIGNNVRTDLSNVFMLGKSNQTIMVGEGTSVGSGSIFQIDSTTKGFLPPRGTNTQMLAIASPATGLMFYDTTNNKLNCYDGTTWQACW